MNLRKLTLRKEEAPCGWPRRDGKLPTLQKDNELAHKHMPKQHVRMPPKKKTLSGHKAREVQRKPAAVPEHNLGKPGAL